MKRGTILDQIRPSRASDPERATRLGPGQLNAPLVRASGAAGSGV